MGFGDKEILTDALQSEKFLTSGYNTSSIESATPAIRSEFVNILTDEHQIQNEIFTEMQNRGWYPVEAAEQVKINQAKQKYSAQNM